MASVEDRVKGLVTERLGVSDDQVTPEASFTEDLNADSLDLVELIMAFEEECSKDGDALEISGSNVSINQTKASNVKDKAVSAGEKSMLTVKDSNFNNIGVGVASKDGSSVIVSGVEILNYKLYGAMSYLKKDFYDIPSLTISNSIVSDGGSYIRQKGTSLSLIHI